MNKAILPLLLFCFALLSSNAQVENKQPTAATQQSSVEQSKMAKEQMTKERADVNQTNPQVNNPNAPVITFDKMEHDYGTLDQNADGTCEFKFTNTGKEPLILSNVRAS